MVFWQKDSKTHHFGKIATFGKSNAYIFMVKLFHFYMVVFSCFW